MDGQCLSKNDKKKIILFTLNASYIHTSLSLRCLYDGILKSGLFTGEKGESVIDLKLIEKNINDRHDTVLFSLYSENADYYCFSSYIWNNDELCRQAENLKALLPDCKIIFGGPEISNADDDYIKNRPFIDYVIRGEGEKSLSLLIHKLISGKNTERIISSDFYDGFINDGTHYAGNPPQNNSLVYYESSRGCPFRCAYCLSGCDNRQLSAKSATQTLDELLDFEKYDNIGIIKFVDRTFNFNLTRAKEIWRGLKKEKYTKTYHFEICSELLDDEAFELLSTFPKGKIQFEVGIQSTNPKTLSAIRRYGNTDTIIENNKRLRSFGNINIHADLIVGLPFEDYNSFVKSFDDVYFCCDNLQVGFLKLLKGSYLREIADSFGCVYSSSAPYTVLKTDCLSFEEVMTLHEITDAVERYSNSERFSCSIMQIKKYIASPFRFYEGLNEFIRKNSEIKDLRKLPQRKAYEFLYLYCKSIPELCDNELLKADIYDALCGDFISNEVGRLPFEMKSR